MRAASSLSKEVCGCDWYSWCSLVSRVLSMMPRIVPFGLWMRTWVSSKGCMRSVMVGVGILSRLGLIG